MNREQERIRKNLEKNPVAECNKFQKKYYPMLFEKFAGVKDPRHQSYIEYTTNLPFTTDQAVPELLFPLLRVTLEQVRISQINGQKGI